MIYDPLPGSRKNLLIDHGLTDILRRRLVFTVCSGRCGTATLAELFKLIEGGVSLHEPAPAYDSVLNTCQRNADAAMTFLLEAKLPAILEYDSEIYVETSHLLCKGFIEPFLELGIRPTFIFVHRDLSEVAYSFYLLDSVPARSDLGRNFMLSPAGPCLLQLADWEELSDYQLCYWYCLEMIQRMQLYRHSLARYGIPRFDVQVADIQNLDSVRKLVEGVTGYRIEDSDRLRKVVLQRHNAKSDDKIARSRSPLSPHERSALERIVLRKCELGVSSWRLSLAQCGGEMGPVEVG